MAAKQRYDPIFLEIAPLEICNEGLFKYYILLDENELEPAKFKDFKWIYNDEERIEMSFVRDTNNIIGINLFHNINSISEDELNEIIEEINICMNNIRNMFP